MRILMKRFTTASLLGALAAYLLYRVFHLGVYQSLSITFGTAAYHFGMRLLVGLAYDRRMKNQADYTRKWFRPHPWEGRLYGLLRVKSWKGKLPTYVPESFSREKHTWNEIAQATCQAELVHETICVLSFVPLAFVPWLGAFWVFLLTSVCSALFDLSFVIVQRYNRPRLIKLAERQPSLGKEPHA